MPPAQEEVGSSLSFEKHIRRVSTGIKERHDHILCLVKNVGLDANRIAYPYSKNRVILSAIIALLSTVFALTLLMEDIVLVLYYVLTTFVCVTITYFLKKRLYTLLTNENQAESENETKHTPWKVLLMAFFMFLGFFAIPMLLAGLLSGLIWFIMITSFMSGVNISEIILYVRASSNR